MAKQRVIQIVDQNPQLEDQVRPLVILGHVEMR